MLSHLIQAVQAAARLLDYYHNNNNNISYHLPCLLAVLLESLEKLANIN